MKVYVGSDHNGFKLKATLVSYLQKQGFEVVDDSTGELNPEDDYPVFARKVTADMLASADPEPRGILICGSGQGMCMAANRFKGIRAALGYDRESVRAARNDDDANVLCLAVRTLEAEGGYGLIDTFLRTPFAAAPRFIRRVQEMDQI
ncbi:MAG: ribose 5-phosphate isomerase [Candidatus Saccharibacteria bacterium]|nr:ribose 5-phosphate isomerase [Candidatus Saccharibacteria bacterium]